MSDLVRQERAVLRSCRGLSLIELLVSMFIGLLIMVGVLQMFATTTQNALANSGASRIQENTRYAFYRMSEDIAQAGNLGCFSAPVAGAHDYFSLNGVDPVNNMLGHESNSGNTHDFGTLVHGYDRLVNLLPPVGQVVEGTDTFMVRYVNYVNRLDITDVSGVDRITVDQSNPAYSSLKQFQIVAASDCASIDIFMITNDPKNSNGVLEFKPGVISDGINLGQFNNKGRSGRFVLNNGRGNQGQGSIPYLYAGSTGAYHYYIGNRSGGVCDPQTARQHCSLYRRANGQSVELVAGVHDMDVQYGWTDNNGHLRFGNATAVATANAWAVVDRLRITLSFNSLDNVVTSGNNTKEMLTRTATRTFNLPNQL